MDYRVRIIELPKIEDVRGNLSFFENENHIPFEIQRTYWIYDVPDSESRDGYAYRANQEFIIALSGSFSVSVHNGYNEIVYHLNRSNYGLLIPQMYWRSLMNFSMNSLALVVSSTLFSEEDYIRDFESFRKEVKCC